MVMTRRTSSFAGRPGRRAGACDDVRRTRHALRHQHRRHVRTCASETTSEIPPEVQPEPLLQGYSVARNCCVVAALAGTLVPDVFMGPLMPPDPSLPPFALASAGVALRISSAFLFLQAAACVCLMDAVEKGNLTKSVTYQRLNSGALLCACFTSLLLVLTYALGQCMDDPALGILVALAEAPLIYATVRGAQAQGTFTDGRETMVADAQDLLDDCVTLTSTSPVAVFYQLQLLLCLVSGTALILLPSTIAEAPEPMYTAETLMRRVAGADAAMLFGTTNWLLLDAARRSRLGASTFKKLNLGFSVSVVLTAFWMAWLITRCTDASALEASPIFVLLGVLPGSVYAYQGLNTSK